MPELPDVEGYRRALAESLPGARVREVHVADAGVLRHATAWAFREQLLESRFAQPRRHGKWLVLPTDGPTIVIHNGMTGRPYYTPGAASSDVDSVSYHDDRLVIRTDRGDLHYADRRKLRGLWIVDHDADLVTVTGSSRSPAPKARTR